MPADEDEEPPEPRDSSSLMMMLESIYSQSVQPLATARPSTGRLSSRLETAPVPHSPRPQAGDPGEVPSAPGGEGPGAGGDERGGGGRGRGGRGAGIPPAKREIRRALVERFLAHSTRVTRSRDELRAGAPARVRRR